MILTGWPRPESKPAIKSPLSPKVKTQEPSLSDLNPLFNPVELNISESVEAFKSVTLDLIDQYGGLRPDVLKSMVVASQDPRTQAEYRFIARYEIPGLTKKKIRYIEELVRYTYGANVRTTRSSDGVEVPAVRYPHVDVLSENEMFNTRLEGWYMGPNTTSLDTLHKGLYLFRDVGVTNTKNFLKAEQAKRPRFIVEIREANLFQTDLANLVIETSIILGKGRPVDYGQLLYDTYYSLMRRGLKKEEEGYELDKILRPVRRGLILPLANPQLAGAIVQEPESALLCGVPGTGKSLATRKLLYQDTGVFIIPMDPMLVAKDIENPPEKRKLMPRIAQIRSLSQRPVVLQLDDVEQLFERENKTSSALLNLMEGVQEQGFYVLASTNEPEKIDVALLQPQRLGIRVYCGLPSEQARLRILEMHTPIDTFEGTKLFSSPETRRLILGYVAKNTESFPPRQLGKIATNAKSVLLERVAERSGRTRGLTEEDLNGATFTVDDWEEALGETLETFDLRSTVQRDKEIGDFLVYHEQGDLGFHGITSRNSRSFDEVRRRIAGMEVGPGISSAV